MNLTEMRTIRLWLLAAVLSLAAQAFAQTYPSRPVKIVIPYAPGGALDIMGRTLSKEMQEINGQPYVVENKGGAGGAIAAAEVARASPDGYTILLGAIGPISIAPAVYGASAGFNPMTDLAPISLIATGGVAAATGGALLGSSFSWNSDLSKTTIADAKRVHEAAQLRNQVGIVALAVGAAAAVTGLAVLLLGQSNEPIGASVVPTAGGAVLGIAGTF